MRLSSVLLMILVSGCGPDYLLIPQINDMSVVSDLSQVGPDTTGPGMSPTTPGYIPQRPVRDMTGKDVPPDMMTAPQDLSLAQDLSQRQDFSTYPDLISIVDLTQLPVDCNAEYVKCVSNCDVDRLACSSECDVHTSSCYLDCLHKKNDCSGGHDDCSDDDHNGDDGDNSSCSCENESHGKGLGHCKEKTARHHTGKKHGNGHCKFDCN